MFANTYISNNCNPTPTILDWGLNNLICYGSCNAIYVYDPLLDSGGKITHTLTGHTKRVNSVSWVHGNNIVETEIVSGSADASVIIWSLNDNNFKLQKLEGHQSSVNIVDALYRNSEKNALVASASMDCCVKIWTRLLNGDFEIFQTIDFGYNICITLSLAYLMNDEALLLALTLDNSKIEFYAENVENGLLVSSGTLKAHEDWVRGLDFMLEGENLFLASSSQDNLVKIWRITKMKLNHQENSIASMFQYNVINILKYTYFIYLEAVLMGHEGWVYSVNWNQTRKQLLSSSLDKTMIIWEADVESGLWLEKARLGEVGGNTLGFYGGLFGPAGDSILGHSYHGAFHLWKFSSDNCLWKPQVTVGGHFGEVVDLAWDSEGEYLLSVSTDQTARIHAPWSKIGKKATWHEIARPQIHGYDMSAVAIIAKHKYASSAEEKVIRIFEAPNDFNQMSNNHDRNGAFELKRTAVPSLGLSNKAIYTNGILPSSSSDESNEESQMKQLNSEEPPTEEVLLQNTLWPEHQKLYGHGYEVYSLAASPDGVFLASSCKSTTLEHAAVLLWKTTGELFQKLLSHTLTVAQISFSPDSQCLLTVSRDRRWSLFRRNSSHMFELVATTDKKSSIHTRIIWCCAWSHDSKYFATGSRDGKVCVWNGNENKITNGSLGTYQLASEFLNLSNDSITALAFCHNQIGESYLIAVGFETGCISLYKWTRQSWNKVLELFQRDAHHLAVTRISFRPLDKKGNHDCNILQLASSSRDFSIKIYDIFVNKI